MRLTVNMSFKQFLYLCLTFLTLSGSRGGWARVYQDCRPDDRREQLDDFCPKLEGTPLDHCCPEDIRRNTPLTCHYAVGTTETFLSATPFVKCINGANETRQCCGIRVRSCQADLIIKSFISRLLKRNGQCCFEASCPPADYWRSPPAAPGFTPNHRLTTPGSLNCTDGVIRPNECSPDLAMCDSIDSSNDPCPSPPDPGPPDSGPPGPSPPDPSPSDPSPPDPGPPDPGPAPDPPAPPSPPVEE